ncbi:histidine kinase dimerization/phospho-acceptor domain-containing protein [Tistrella sp. BH-R2-4]|uniref:histidine kinase n=1 Tax=Tistrella arctica TaxID=3133430 RepID=A0ABU9YE73_9PROT
MTGDRQQGETGPRPLLPVPPPKHYAWLRPAALAMMLAALLLFSAGLLHSNNLLRQTVLTSHVDLSQTVSTLRRLERCYLELAGSLHLIGGPSHPGPSHPDPSHPDPSMTDDADTTAADVLDREIVHMTAHLSSLRLAGPAAVMASLPDGEVLLAAASADLAWLSGLRAVDVTPTADALRRHLAQGALRLDPAIRHLEATLTDDQQTVRNSLIELQTLGQMSAAGILATVAGLGLLATLMHHGQKRSHQRLRSAIDTMSDGFVHIDRNGRVTVANDQLLRYLPRETLSVGGLGTAEGLGRAIALATADPETTRGTLAAILGGARPPALSERRRDRGRPSAGQIDIALAEGRWLRLRSHVGGDDGRAVALIDVTAEHRDLAQRHRKALVFEHLTDGLVVADAQGMMIDVSPSTARIYGAEPAALWGQPLGLLIQPSDAINVTRGIMETLRDQDVVTRSFPIARPAPGGGMIATGRTAEATLIALHDPSAGFDGAIAVIRDVSEVRRMDRLKAAFVAVAAHELRTPTTAIVGALKLACSGVGGPVSEPLAGLLRMAMRNGDRLTAVIDDILDVERLESGQFTLAHAPIVLSLLLNTVATEAAATAGSHLIISPAPSAAVGLTLPGDLQRLVQALVKVCEYVSAAVDGTATIGLDWRIAGDRLHLSAALTQPETAPTQAPPAAVMPPQAQPPQTVRRAGYIGFGLATARALIERHGGTLSYTADDGIAGRFDIDLPATEPVVAA